MQVTYSPRPRASRHRWLISYADFVTLLLAVFVVLFAAERHGNDTARQVSAAVAGALKSQWRVTPAEAPAKTPERTALTELTTQLRQEIAGENVTVQNDSRGVVVSLQEAMLFRSGSADIDRASYPMVEKLARILTGVPNSIRLEGHTDNTPIRNSRFKSNWELSAARSIAVLELLVNRYGISRDRLSVSAFAGNMPVSPNDQRDGRARNRRVDVVILSAQ
jgi:chemotaxis protein MotB